MFLVVISIGCKGSSILWTYSWEVSETSFILRLGINVNQSICLDMPIVSKMVPLASLFQRIHLLPVLTFSMSLKMKTMVRRELLACPLSINQLCTGTDTLHGGTDGFDRRIWTIKAQSKHSATFTLVDPDGTQGFPGTVHASVTYTLAPKSVWEITMHATATEKTPIMLSGHHYWNLEAYQETQDLVGHQAEFASSKVIATDGQLIPTGELLDVEGTALDFRAAKSIGGSINATAPFAYCGNGT